MMSTVDTITQFNQSRCIRSETVYKPHRFISECVGFDKEYINLKKPDCCV